MSNLSIVLPYYYFCPTTIYYTTIGVIMKKCSTCKIERPFELFGKSKRYKDGFKSQCKICTREYAAKYRKENKQKTLDYAAEYRRQNKEKNQKKKAEYQRNRRQTDPAYKMRNNVSVSIHKALKAREKNKTGSVWEALPYSSKQLCEHLEAQFDEHMSWDNHGSYWHVDHIYPQSLLPYDNYEDPNFQKCWALENLRPLEATMNVRKSNKIE